jgi:type I restriction enzyme, S subunit
VREGWTIKKLGEIAKFQGGSQPPKSKFISEPRDGYVRLLQIRDFKSDRHTVYVPISSKNRMCVDSDIMIGRYGASVGQIHRGKAGAYNVALIKATPNETLIDQDFFYLFLNSSHFQTPLASIADRSAQAGFSREDISGFEVPLPRLAEQRRIVALLDEVFAGLATATVNAEKNLKNARDLWDSYLNSILAMRGRGWQEKRLADVARVFGRGKSRHRPRNDPKLYGGPYPFVQTGDLSNADHWLTGYTQTYSALGLAQSRLWPKGTVCIAIVGATVGETAILEFEACFPDSVIGIVVDESIADAEYVEFLLQAFKAVLKEKGKGTARDNINLGTFENQLFPFPSLKEQQMLVEQLNEIAVRRQELEDLYNKKLAAISELKQSVLQKAFSGELTSPFSQVIQAAAE